MSEHSENVRAAVLWALQVFAGPHAKTIPVEALQAIVERSEGSADSLIEIRDGIIALLEEQQTGGQLEKLESVRLGLVASNAWLEAILDDQHGADLLIKLEAVRALLAGTLTTRARLDTYTESTATLAGGATFTGNARDAAGKELRGLAVSDVAGTLHLEVSTDGNAPWMRIASQAAAQVGGVGLYVATVTHAPVLPFARWVYVNGGGAQASFNLSGALVAA